MRKTLIAVAAAATIAVATVATPNTAEARWGGWWGPAIGAFAVGAIVGSAFARPYYYGGYYPSYSYAPAYSYGYPAYSYGSAPAYYGYASAPGAYYGCWRYRNGYRYRVC